MAKPCSCRVNARVVCDSVEHATVDHTRSIRIESIHGSGPELARELDLVNALLRRLLTTQPRRAQS